MKEIFPIVPATGGPVWMLAALGLVMLASLALLGSFAYASRRARFEVTPGALRIAGTPYGRRIPTVSLVLEAARVVDLTTDPNLRPVMRTNGAGLLGFSAGWFRLRNRDKALVFVTDRRRVLFLPTRLGYAILLSVARPEDLLAALRRA